MVSSCKKKSSPQTIADVMPGKWRLTKYGSDDNLNGRIDNFETRTVANGTLFEMDYKGDGTGVQTNITNGVKSPDLKFNWEFLTYDSLRISYDANDTVTYYVNSSSSGAIGLTTATRIQNSNEIGIQWLFFTKQ